jgi:hypothetical protein
VSIILAYPFTLLLAPPYSEIWRSSVLTGGEKINIMCHVNRNTYICSAKAGVYLEMRATDQFPLFRIEHEEVQRGSSAVIFLISEAYFRMTGGLMLHIFGIWFRISRTYKALYYDTRVRVRLYITSNYKHAFWIKLKRFLPSASRRGWSAATQAKNSAIQITLTQNCMHK